MHWARLLGLVRWHSGAHTGHRGGQKLCYTRGGWGVGAGRPWGSPGQWLGWRDAGLVSPVPGEGRRVHTRVRGDAVQRAAGEAALAVPGAVAVVGAAVGAGGSAPPGALRRAEAGFGWRGGRLQLAVQPARPHGARPPRSHGGLWTRGAAPWRGDTQAALPGWARRQRVQQPWVQHFSPAPHAVSLRQLIPQLAPMAMPARGQ